MQTKPKAPKKSLKPEPSVVSGGSNPTGVIYIDQDSDITSIVSKIRQESAKNIKLVVPKNSSALKSGVNLKLLKRTAHGKMKELSLITSDSKLISMAGSAKIATAPNLNAEPKLIVAAASAVAASKIRVNSPDDEEEVQEESSEEPEQEDVEEDLTIDGSELESSLGAATAKAAKQKAPKGKKVPNFHDFRKKALIGLGAFFAVLIVVLLVMTSKKAAIIQIRANAERMEVNFVAKLNENATETTKDELKVVKKSGSKSVTETTPATGEQDIGAKASGSMTLSIPCSAVSGGAPTVSKGTAVTAKGLNFLTQSAVTLDDPSFSGGCKFTGSTTVVAENSGDQYNLAAQSYKVAGSSSITGSGSQMTGGTTQIIKVVSEADVNTLKEKLSKTNEDAYRQELKSQFTSTQQQLEDTFIVTLGKVQLTPAVGQQADQLSGTVTVDYSMYGVEKEELNKILDLNINDLKKDESQGIVKNGVENLKITPGKDGKFNFSTVAYLGPTLDQDQIKREVAGKKKGEAIQYVKSLEGVDDAKVKITPFWASTLPGENKIEIKIEIAESSKNT